ncbi:MAG: Gfo/Idh/MocA family oxidoreductase [Candidatus Berkelbacteria bacterium]|nr:Gfo/Idh/MocA family oxidoreductase [Candidatus Berkelbacteria bacterium]
MAKKKVRVGLVGYMFMGKAHSLGYRDVAFAFPDVKAVPVMKEISGLDGEEARIYAARYGWERSSVGYERVCEAKDIDLVDISTGNDSHREICLAAARNGKHIFCEKPMAMSVVECKDMIKAVEKAGVIHMIDFNYRTVPAVALAKQMVEKGMIGTPYHFRAVYLQDWIIDPEFPLVWRLQKDKAGSGAHGDLNAHIIDLGRYLCGEFDSVCGMMETFIKNRPLLAAQTGGLSAEAAGDMGAVTVDDATLFLAKFQNGAVGTFEATRFATGNRNGNHFELNGSDGSIRFNLERMNELEYFSRKDKDAYQGWKTILVTDPTHPYIKGWWPAGHIIGWQHTFVHQVYNLMNGIATGINPSPNFYDGLKCQAVLEAVEESVETEQWVKVKVDY